MLYALIQLLYSTENPLLCSGVYSGFIFVFGLIYGDGIIFSVLNLVISFFFAYLYFWLLNEYKEGMLHWGIMLSGLFMGFIL
jgi:hypothetical protein